MKPALALSALALAWAAGRRQTAGAACGAPGRSAAPQFNHVARPQSCGVSQSSGPPSQPLGNAVLVNAAHAVGDLVKGGSQKGLIRVRTCVEQDAVVISIVDTGCGIPESVRDEGFDPFFTAKEVGRGTGRGLAIARSIVVHKHGGTLTFESKE
jgi:C4-dicarboxylate-specific signal transduction histidine kinase